MRGKLVLVCMRNSFAASYANYGSGRSSESTALERCMKDLEFGIPRTFVALHNGGKHNAAPDASPRLELLLSGRDPHPERRLRRKFRNTVE